MNQVERQQAFDRLLATRDITIVFQPIWDHQRGQPLGFEALARGPENSYFHMPITLFEYARASGQLIELELKCAEIAIEQFKHLQLQGKLFINFSPDTLFGIYRKYDVMALTKFSAYGIALVFELTEHYPIDIDESAQQCLSALKQLGIEIAIDDFGTGYAGFKNWLDIKPRYIKLDRFFAQGLSDEGQIMQAVAALRSLAETLNCELIAEGIENKQSFENLIELNVRYLQGFFIARPSAQPRLQSVPTRQKAPEPLEPYTAASLLIKTKTVKPATSSRHMLRTMLEDKSVTSTPVVDDDGKIVGIIKREELLARYSGPYGHSLNQRTTVAEVMLTNPLVVDIATPLSEIGSRLSQHTASGLDASFIITKNNRYVGIGLAVDVMRRLSDYKLQLARYANPLTLLPGNVPLQRHLNNLMNSETAFSLAYFDLNNFKPFNDCCGYERGDKMIKLVANLLNQQLSGLAHFVGHLGGDDFIVLFTQDGWQTQLPKLLADFNRQSRSLYRAEDLERQSIVGKDREGKEQIFQLVGLAIGVTYWDTTRQQTLDDLSEAASYAKKQAKKYQKSAIYYHNTNGEQDHYITAI
jgi:diguanylate cyclase (GGDEF)-like protein